jgi:predicted TIM-barrel fold metal-dependent hydrolase
MYSIHSGRSSTLLEGQMTDPMFVFDADEHYYETRDAFTRYLGEEYRARSVSFRTGPKNENYVFIGDQPLRTLPEFYPGLQAGNGLDDFFDALANNEIDNRSASEMQPEWFASAPRAWFGRNERLALMDAQGVHATLLLPSLGVELDSQLMSAPDGVDLAHAIFRAGNRWLEDEWGYQGRIFAVPQIRLYDLDQGLDELNRVIALGARVVNLYIGPQAGESPAATRFDPFWKRICEANVAVAFHFGGSGGGAYFADHIEAMWGSALAPASRSAHEWSPFLFFSAFGDRPIMDTMASLIFWNLFDRYPGLKIVSIENGGGPWLEYMLHTLDKAALFARNGAWPGGRPEAKPSEILRSRLSVVPFPEDSLSRVVELIGGDNTLTGSDYPHPEGLSAPLRMLERVKDLSENDVRKVMGLNAARLVGMSDQDVAELVATVPSVSIEDALLAHAS